MHRGGRYYVIEIKTCENSASCDSAAKKAMQQIQKRGYYEKFPKESTTLLGLAIDLSERKIGHVLVEKG